MFCSVAWKCFSIQIMLGIFKSVLIWQRRELCETSEQGLTTFSLAWVCAVGWTEAAQTTASSSCWWRLFGAARLITWCLWEGWLRWKGTTTKAINDVQDTEPPSLYSKSGVFCKVGSTFLEHSGFVSKFHCFFNSHLALRSPPPDPHHIGLRGAGGPWFSPCPPASSCSNTVCTLLIYS